MTNEAHKRIWNYTTADIARLSGNSINTVRDHKENGTLRPDDLGNVCGYIRAHNTLNEMKQEAKAKSASKRGNKKRGTKA